MVSKLDSVRRQLEVAVRIYFTNGDPVSTHTLAAAAYSVIRDLNSAKGGSPMFVKDDIFKHIKPEFVDRFRAKLNEAENFFKHADHDPDKVLEFRSEQTELLLLDACQKYREIAGEGVAELELYRTWFMLQNPNAFIVPPELQSLHAEVRMDYPKHGRERFFGELLPLVLKQGVTNPGAA